MRKSENYGLNLVEGSDIVNPLVQDVPNYEIIDEEMAKNANAGIPVATELLTGTVHALTRENPNASMFRFVATANYKTGDTFTVDGVQVTALLTTGEPLATGCYVINSNVLCCLVGTVLTMFCANSLAEIHAVDSDKLGGELPSYYAKASSVVEAVNLAQNANDISLANQEAIGKLNDISAGESVEEREIGVWCNGQKLYCKSLIVNLDSSWSDSGSYVLKSIKHDIENIKTVTRIIASINGYPLPYFTNGVAVTYVTNTTLENVTLANKANWSTYQLRIYLEYIKTIDG